MRTASLIVMVLCFVTVAPVITQQANAVDMPGLIGIQYGDEDFEKAEDFVKLTSLGQSWGADDGFGKQWAGKWQGFIIGPATGDVKFTLATDQEANIEIAGKVVLSSKKGLMAGSVKMVKGKKYPIALTYVKEGSEYDCTLKVQWSWAGQTLNTVEGDSLVYLQQTEAELREIVGEAEDKDDDDDDDKEDEQMGLVEGLELPKSDVIGLWLFDEPDYPHTTLTDASEYAKADLCLMDAGSMVSGRFGNALQVSGSGYAICYAGFAGKVPQEEMRGPDGAPSGLWGPTESPEALLDGLSSNLWTIGLWLNPVSTGSKLSIIDMGQAYEPGLSLNLKAGSFELINHYAAVKITFPTAISADKWQHVAFTYNGTTARHYLDGKEQTTATVTTIRSQPIPDPDKPKDREHESRGFENMDFEQRRKNRFNFAVGTDRHRKNPGRFKIDELRISKVVRYTGNFTPQSFSRNYGTSATTPAVANGPPLLFDPEPSSMPLNFGTRRHVFIDDAIIDAKENVQITLNPPFGKQLLELDFEIKKSAWRPSVFEVKDEIFMAIPESYSSNEGLTVLATSKDGLSFKKKGKIIPETPMYGAFFKDLNPDVPVEHRYKVNSYVANRGMYFYTSPDGLNWRRNETIQLPLVSGGGGECYWDDQQGKYISFIKRDSSFRTKEYPGIGPHGHKAIMFESNEILKPWPFKPIAKPWYEGWPFPSVTGEGVTAFTAQKYGWVYRTRAIKYPWAPDTYLAFIWRYPGDDGARHVELAVSRNGREWKFFGTNWYIPTGAAEEEITMYGLIRRSGEIWQYVNEGGAHGGSAPRYWSRYKQRLDGFVSLDAGATVGEATTLPLKFKGSNLVLNINATGSAKVAITDPNGNAVSGFGFDDCELIKGDFIEREVRFKSGKQIKALQDKVVRLKFRMQNAKLYAFEFMN